MNDLMIPNGHYEQCSGYYEQCNGHYEQCTCSINEVSDQGWDQVHVLSVILISFRVAIQTSSVQSFLIYFLKGMNSNKNSAFQFAFFII